MKKLILCAIVIAFVACQKKTVNEKLFVRGRLFLTDNETQNSTTNSLGDVTVYLSADDPANNPNFLQSVKSDPEGFFVFNLDPSQKRDYYVYSEYKLNNLLFKQTKHVTDDANVSLELQFDNTSQNGLKLALRDISNGFLPQADVFFYSSLLVAQLDDTLGTNAFKKTTSDNNGFVRLFNIGEGNYYVNSRKRFGNVLIDRKLKVITISKTGIVADSMLLN
jgi:hypothetical protein